MFSDNINSSNAIALEFGVFTKTEHIFAQDDFSAKTKYDPLHQETLIYNCQTATPRRHLTGKLPFL
jgi:hypothetical protein